MPENAPYIDLERKAETDSDADEDETDGHEDEMLFQKNSFVVSEEEAAEAEAMEQVHAAACLCDCSSCCLTGYRVCGAVRESSATRQRRAKPGSDPDGCQLAKPVPCATIFISKNCCMQARRAELMTFTYPLNSELNQRVPRSNRMS